jgi:transposase
MAGDGDRGHAQGEPPICPGCRERDSRIERLERLVEQLQEENRQLREENRRLVRRVEALEARLKQDSRNSSRPPSSDPPQIRYNRPPKPPSGKKPGGQPGHEGTTREFMASSKVDKILELWPEECGGCRRKFGRRDRRKLTLRQARRHQVTEIPEPKPETTEYRMHGIACADTECGQVTWAELPEGVPEGRFGPRVQATVAILTGRYRASKREAQAQMQDLHGVRMSLGQISAIEGGVSAALKKPVREAHQYAQKQVSAGADETSWPQGKKAGRRKAWLWVMVTASVTVFRIELKRSARAARRLLGKFSGTLSTDRWKAYGFHRLDKRQICWSHLGRDFEGMGERKGSRRIGEALLGEMGRMFAWWYRVRDGTLQQSSFATYMVEVRAKVKRLLKEGTRCRDPITRGKCREILEVFPALWTFVRVPGIEPTNNACERALRAAVLWRKGCFGTRSAAGSRFVERMLTAAATLRQQERSLLAVLTEAIQARQQGTSPPSLLPDPRWLARLQATA